MIQKPGDAGELCKHLFQTIRGGRPVTTDKDDKLSQAVELRGKGIGLREIAKTVGVAKSTVDRWLLDYDLSQKHPGVGQFGDTAEPDGETPN